MSTLPTDEEVLEAIDRFWEGMETNLASPYPYQDEILREKYSEEQIYAKMEDLSKRELIDYGVSLRTAWRVEPKRE